MGKETALVLMCWTTITVWFAYYLYRMMNFQVLDADLILTTLSLIALILGISTFIKQKTMMASRIGLYFSIIIFVYTLSINMLVVLG